MARTDKIKAVCADFVSRTTRSAKYLNTSGALHNRGEHLFSYALNIASHDGEGNIILHVRRNTPTTNRHISAVRLAAHLAGKPIIETEV
jgi:hypothetical protein